MIAANCLLFLFSFLLIEEYRNTTRSLTWKVRFYFTLRHLFTDFGRSCAKTGKIYCPFENLNLLSPLYFQKYSLDSTGTL